MENKSKRKKPAFTLAETLITLGIIGVVAAMTLPIIITNAQKHSVVTGIQETLSILNQALKMYIAETGDTELVFDTSLSAQEFAEKFFKPYLKVVKVCTSISDGCWVTDGFNGYYDLAGNKITEATPYSLVLSNGMIAGFSKISGTSLHSIVVDINGKSRKNIMGRDVFVFYLYNRESLCGDESSSTAYAENIKMKNNIIYPGGFDNCGTPHIIFTREELLSKSSMLRPCNPNAGASGDGGRTGVGSACAALIAKDGWKISKDYPW